MSVRAKATARLPPEANRILYVRNLPFKITNTEIGVNPDTRGTAFVVYEDIYDAKAALDALQGFSVNNRYLIVLYFQQSRITKRLDTQKKERELELIREKFGLKKEAESEEPPKKVSKM